MGYVPGIVSITTPGAATQFYEKFQGPRHVTARLLAGRGGAAWGIKSTAQTLSCILPCCGVTAASCAVPWIQAAPWRGMPLASDNRHSTLPSRRFWTSIRTAKYSRFAGETSVGRLYRNAKIHAAFPRPQTKKLPISPCWSTAFARIVAGGES